MKRTLLLFLFGTSILYGCGGSSDDSSSLSSPQNSPPIGSSTAFDSTGELTLPANSNDFNGNVLLRVQADDPLGLSRVVLRFSDNGPDLVLCDSEQVCGASFSDTVSGVNPGSYGALPGPITVRLDITNSNAQTRTVSTLNLNWQPPAINNVLVSRSANDSDITISWDLNPDLLRYNLYLAAQTDVNQSNYHQLPQGQALLAVEQGPQTFSGLNAATDYFVLLAGVDGSGESTNLQEVFVPSSGLNPNSNPVAVDDVATVNEDETVTIDALQNDSDPDGDPLTLTAANASQGTASINNNQIDYVPDTDFNGAVTIDYTVSDGNGGNATAQVNVTVVPVNDPPEAFDDFANTQQDTLVNIPVLDNDFDIDGDAISIIGVVYNNGTGTIETDNTITYEPDSGFVGTDDFQYTIDDGNGGTATAIVEIDVGLDSRPPIANADNYVAFVGDTLSVDASQGLLVNDADPDGDAIFVIVPSTDPSAGTLTLATDGSFDYVPGAGFTGNDTFDYTIVADNGQTRTSSVTIEVKALPADLAGDSLSMSGEFLYLGRGEFQAGTQRGSGLYRIGDCLQDSDTRCAMQGEYVQAATSGDVPGETGRYAFFQSYSGNGDSPVLAVSRTARSNVLSFSQVGDVRFDLYLFPDTGGIKRGLFPEEPFENSINFGAFIDTAQTCTGLPVGTPCNIGEVGLVNGAELRAPLDRLNFSQPGAKFAGDDNQSPQAQEDTYTTSIGAQLIVNAPGVLTNDSDPDTPIIGDTLEIVSQFSNGLGPIAAIGFDEYSQRIYSAANLNGQIQVNNRLSTILGSFAMQGELSENIDIEIAPEAFQMAGTLIPQGTVLIFNGQVGSTEIYAYDETNRVLLAQLNTSFGTGDVVGGAYNPVTNTFFLLQKNNGGPGVPAIAEISPATGATLVIHNSALDVLDYDVGFGDIDINNQTGSLYVISSLEIGIFELTSSGGIVRQIVLPPLVSLASGLAVSEDGERFWVSSQDGNLYELAFANDGVAQRLTANDVVTTENGTLVTGRDGSFIYTPNAGFVGEDIFTYEVQDGKGKNSLTNVRITVNN